jgi:hypothetical protein
MTPRAVAGLVLACGLAGCGDDAKLPDKPTTVALIVAPESGDDLLPRLVERAEHDLKAMVGPQVAIERPGSWLNWSELDALARRHGAALVVSMDEPCSPSAACSTHRAPWNEDLSVATSDRGDWPNAVGGRGSTVIRFSSWGSRLGRQYRLYEILRRLGARYYHPEQAFLPPNPPSVIRARARTPTVTGNQFPAFPEVRAFTFHATHPLEHLEAFGDGRHPIDEAVRVNEWIIQSRGNRMRGTGRSNAPPEARTKRSAELETLRKLLGFPRAGGISLHNEQQGADADIDPSKPEPLIEQVKQKVAKDIAAAPDVTEYGIHFGPTEFTTTPDLATLELLNAAGLQALKAKPSVTPLINVHITGSQPVAHLSDLGCPPGTNGSGKADYYDLAFHADTEIALQVHTVMFYPLEGPARVYNQQSFAHKLCLMQTAIAAGRKIVWFPEGSWWLSFDNPVPVYLPLYVWSRHRDVQLLAPQVQKGGIIGHKMFNSGHEWGYWQQDYAVGILHWNANATLRQIWDEIFDPLCDPAQWQGCSARTLAGQVMDEVMAAQKREFLDAPDWQGKPGGRYAYFAGEDAADEIGAATGFEFRPVRIAFQQVGKWSEAQMKTFAATDLAALGRMDDEYHGWVARLNALRPNVPAAGVPWLDEIVDGLQINGLRARHARLLYTAVIAWRKQGIARAAEDELGEMHTPAEAAAPFVQAAQKALADAETVIRRREKHYRYPAAQVYGEGDNGTTYPWRVHTKTHLLSYWHNRQQQVEAFLAGQRATQGPSFAVVVHPAIAAPGKAVALEWPKNAIGAVDFGEGTVAAAGTAQVMLASGETVRKLAGSVTVAGTTLPIAGTVARAQALGQTEAGQFTLSKPNSPVAQSVLGTLFPALKWARTAADGTLVLGVDSAADGDVRASDTVVLPVALAQGPTWTSVPVDFTLPIAVPGAGELAFLLHARQVWLSSNAMPAKGFPATIRWQGDLVLQDLVTGLVKLAGFDEKGALQTLSGILAFDPKQPPETVPFAGEVPLAPWTGP